MLQPLQPFGSTRPLPLDDRVVIVGAGQAALQCASALRQNEFAGSIQMLGAEAELPYRRPLLSRGFLDGTASLEQLALRPPDFYATQRIECLLGTSVSGIDRRHRRLRLSDGSCLPYRSLVLATGSRAADTRIFRSHLDGVFGLRQVSDAIKLRSCLSAGSSLVVIGGGYLGLEIAWAARTHGLDVTLIESAPQLLSRVTGPEIADHVASACRLHGIKIRLRTQVARFEGAHTVRCVRLTNGERLPCDLVFVSTGTVSNQEIAASAGLECDDGIRVCSAGRTSDPSIYAIGDCANQPIDGSQRRARIQSVHNAISSGSRTAAAILGKPATATEPPAGEFSVGEIKLQSAGLYSKSYQRVVRRMDGEQSFCVFYLHDGIVAAVDAVDAPADFMTGQQLVAAAAPADSDLLASAATRLAEIA